MQPWWWWNSQPLRYCRTHCVRECDTTSKQFCERIDFYRKYICTSLFVWRSVAGNATATDGIIIIHHHGCIVVAWWPPFSAFRNELLLRTSNVSWIGVTDYTHTENFNVRNRQFLCIVQRPSVQSDQLTLVIVKRFISFSPFGFAIIRSIECIWCVPADYASMPCQNWFA